MKRITAYVFEEEFKIGLAIITLQLLNHLYEDLDMSGSIRLPDPFAYEPFNVALKREYWRTSMGEQE